MTPPKPSPSADQLRATAARWIVRRDRGLSTAESIEYELWLASDPSHDRMIQQLSSVWSRLDHLPESAAAPVLAFVDRRRSFWQRTLWTGTLAAAAAVTIGFVVWSRQAPVLPPSSVEFVALDAPRTITLADGSLVHLNTGGKVIEQFTATERHVLLAQGEAHFSVTKNPARPFIVRAGALQVRAVGTAFDVNLRSDDVDVIVTEGRVQLTTLTAPATASAPALDAGERAVFRSDLKSDADLTHALVRSHLGATELADALAWRAPLLRLGGATLAELAVAFERGTGKRLVFADPSLGELRFGGRFRADDLEGFIQVLATTLDLAVERSANGKIVLRKKNPVSR